MARDELHTLTGTTTDTNLGVHKRVTGTDVADKRALDVALQGGGSGSSIPQISDDGTSVLESVTTAEEEITAVVGQQGIIITNVGGGVIHYTLNTGVTTSNAEIRRDEILILGDYAGSVFVRRASGTGDIQIDRLFKT